MLLHADGFDNFGNDESNLLDGVYANAAGELSSSIVATGTHSFFVSAEAGLSAINGLRKVLPAAKDKLGVMSRVYFPELPKNAYEAGLFIMLPPSTTRNSQLSFVVGANGEIHIIRGGRTNGNSTLLIDGTILASTDPLLVAAAFNHVEVQAYIHDTLGWVRIAVNGVHKFEATGLDTANAAGGVSSIYQGRPFNSTDSSSRFYIDDYIIYDFLGDPAVYKDWCATLVGDGKATNYIGEWQAMTLMPTADTAQEDWLKSTGADSYALVDESTPNDVDYIYSDTAGQITELEFADLPPEVSVIRGVVVRSRLSKSDAGPAMFKAGFKSAGVVGEAAERPVTVEPTYWDDQVNVDPNTAARWTRAGLNAALLRVNRSV
jgi:hypothetical protein